MSITRYFPPDNPSAKLGEDRHMTMNANRHGPYVLYTSHVARVQNLEKQIAELKAALANAYIPAIDIALEELS